MASIQQQLPRAKKPSGGASATAAGKKKATAKKKSDDNATATATAASTSVKGKRKRPLGKQQQQRDEDEDALDEDGGFENEDSYGDDDDDDDDAQSNSQLSTEADGESKSVDTGPDEEKPKPRRGRRRMLHDEEQRKQRRKNQCKLNQRRYRARQRGMISTLSLETDTLTDFIHELEAYQQFLFKYKQNEAALSTQQSASSGGRRQRDLRPLLVVDQFFHFFKHGFALHSIEISDIQERFVRFISAPNFISQGATKAGVDALLLQLKRYTSYHAIFELHLDSRRVVHSPEQQQHSSRASDSEEEKAPSAVSSSSMWVVQVSGRMHLRLSRDTVMLVYPHIVKDEELSYRVVGHEIDPPFSVVFQFNELGKLCKLELMVDFAGAFMHLLNSAEQVAVLLGRALISPHCELGIDPHEESAIGPGSGENKQLSLKFILL